MEKIFRGAIQPMAKMKKGIKVLIVVGIIVVVLIAGVAVLNRFGKKKS